METALGLLLIAATTFNTSSILPVSEAASSTSTPTEELAQTENPFIEKTTENVVLNVPFYHQVDDLPEDKKTIIGSTACGPTAVTMVLSYMKEDINLWQVIENLPDTVYVKGKMFYNLYKAPEYFGYKAVKFKNSPQEMYKHLEEGKPIIINVQNYDGITGHALVVVGIMGFDGENAKSLIVHDPWKEGYREFAYVSKDVLKQPEGYNLPIGILDPFVIE